MIIVVATENASLNYTIQHELRDLPYAINFCDQNRLAREIVGPNTPDVLFLDTDMDIENIIPYVKDCNAKNGGDTQIVLMGSKFDSDRIISAVYKGADDFTLTKDEPHLIAAKMDAVHKMYNKLSNYEEKIQYLERCNSSNAYKALHDGLTGLPNKLLFDLHLEKALSHAYRDSSIVAVLFIDLDGFKNVNDSWGHSYGDEVLCLVAEEIVNSVRVSDTIARIGGDEFLLLLPRVKTKYDAAIVSSSIISTLDDMVIDDSNKLKLSCSIGIALYPDDGVEGDDLIEYADAAMYHAKYSGKKQYKFYSDMES